MLEKLANTDVEISQLIDNLKNTKSRAETIAHLKGSQVDFENLLSFVSANRKLLDAKAPINSLNETLKGIVRGVESDDMDRQEMFALLKSQTYSKKAVEAFDTISNRSKRKRKTEEEEMTYENDETVEVNKAVVENSLSTEWRNALEKARKVVGKETSVAGSSVNPEDDKLKAKFVEWDSMAKNSPSSMKGQKFGIVELPVIPLYEDFTITQSSNLAKLGIKHTIFEGYAVFEKQKVLYFNRADLDKNQSEFDNVQDIVELINMRSSQKYAVASSIFKLSHRNQNIAMFWILPERVLSTILHKQITSGGKRGRSALIKDWSFPFIKAE